jgi:ribose-phosphate pyrophosphokinase
MEHGALQLFALNATREFGARVVEHLGGALSPHEEREFEDGEHKARPLVSVRGRDVFVVQSLYGDRAASVNDKLVRLLFFIGALRDASAARITALIPYLAYARKDAKTQPRDPVTTRYVAALFEAVGTDRVVTLDVHNLAAFQNAFRLRTDHLDTAALFARHFSHLLGSDANIVVVSPDAGGVKRAERLRRMLGRLHRSEPALAFLEKARGQGRLTTGRLVGDVAGCTAIIVDDLISTGSTLIHAAQVCRAAGARRIYGAAAHGLFTGDAAQVLGGNAFDQLVITDTVPPFRLAPEIVRDKLVVVSVARLFADAVRRLHEDASLVELFDEPGA